MSSLSGTWNYPTAVRFGPGRIAELPQACRELGMTAPLLITDAGLAKLPPVTDTLARMTEAGLPAGLFCHVQGNPTGTHVLAGIDALRDGGHDGVIALGGGSALDVAKAVALAAHQDGELWDYEDVDDNFTRVDPELMVPVVAVPTTSGTGSEVGRASVIVDESTHTKRILFHPGMLPARVVADPELTVGLPPGLTAATGLDALSHALEAWCAPGFHPQADGIALEAMRLIHTSLERATTHGTDVTARSHMMAASLMGATAFQKGLGAMHSLAHVIGAHLDLHHGLLNAVVMPYVLEHNWDAIAPRLARLARYLDLGDDPQAFLDRVRVLRRRLGIPDDLATLGLTLDHVGPFAPLAVDDPSTGTNPVPMDAEAFATLLTRAIEGTPLRPTAAEVLAP